MNNKNLLYFIVFVFSLLYLWPIIKFSSNTPFAFDDLKSFVHQFNIYFLSTDSYLDRLSFFFKVTNQPHPQIFVRISSLLSFMLLGEINFRVINIIGACSIPCFAILMVYHNYLKTGLATILVCSVLFVPVAGIVFWKVASITYWMYVTAFLSLHYIYKKRNAEFYMYGFLTTFGSGMGIIMVPLAFLIPIVQKNFFNSSIWKHLVYVLVLFALFFKLSDFSLVGLGTSGSFAAENSLFENLLIKVITIFTIIGQWANKYYGIENEPFQILIGVFILLCVGFVLLKKKSEIINKPLIVLVLFFLFNSATLVMASFVRIKNISDSLWIGYFPRYEGFSAYFFISALLIILSHKFFLIYKSKLVNVFSGILIVIALLVFYHRLTFNNLYLESSKEYSLNNMENYLFSFSPDAPTYNKNMVLYLPKYMTQKLYIPNQNWYNVDFTESVNCTYNRLYREIEILANNSFIMDNIFVIKLQLLSHLEFKDSTVIQTVFKNSEKCVFPKNICVISEKHVDSRLKFIYSEKNIYSVYTSFNLDEISQQFDNEGECNVYIKFKNSELNTGMSVSIEK